MLGAFVGGDERPEARDCDGHEAVAELELGADVDVADCEIAVVGEDVGVEVVETEGCCGDDAGGMVRPVGNLLGKGRLTGDEFRMRPRPRLWLLSTFGGLSRGRWP